MATILFLDVNKASKQLLYALSDSEDLQFANQADLVPIKGEINRASVLEAAQGAYRKAKRYDPRFKTVVSHESADLLDIGRIVEEDLTEELAEFMNQQRENFGFVGDEITKEKLFASHGRNVISNQPLVDTRSGGLRVVLDLDNQRDNALLSIVWDYKRNETVLWHRMLPFESLTKQFVEELHAKALGLVGHCENRYPDRTVDLVVSPQIFKSLPVELTNEKIMLRTDTAVVDLAREAHGVRPYGGKRYKRDVNDAWASQVEDMYIYKVADIATAKIELAGLDDCVAAYLNVDVGGHTVKRTRVSSFFHNSAMDQLVENAIERLEHLSSFREVRVPNVEEFVQKFNDENLRVTADLPMTALPYDFGAPMKTQTKRIVVAHTDDVFASRYVTGALVYDGKTGGVEAHVTEVDATYNARTATMSAILEQVTALKNDGVRKNDIVLVAKDKLIHAALKLLVYGSGKNEYNSEIYDFLLDYKAIDKGAEIFRDSLLAFYENSPRDVNKRSTRIAYEQLKVMRREFRGGQYKIVDRKAFKEYTSDVELPFHHCKSLCSMHVAKLRHEEVLGSALTIKQNGENIPSFLDSIVRASEKVTGPTDKPQKKSRSVSPKM